MVAKTTMSYLVQMAGLTVHNFVWRPQALRWRWLDPGFFPNSLGTLGNFWADLARCVFTFCCRFHYRCVFWFGRACRRS